MVSDPADRQTVKLGEKFKQLEYPDGTHSFTKARIEAVAWATYRRGHAKWEGHNIPNQIASYLTNLGYPMRNEDARYVIEWVAKHKFGYATLANVGTKDRKRYAEFNFFRNYDISNCTPKGLLQHKVKGQPANLVKNTVSNGSAPELEAVVHDEPQTHIDPVDHLKQRAEEERARQVEMAKPVLTPPMPFEPPKPKPYRLEQLDELLTDWADVDPENYAKWVDGVIESFQYR